MPIFIFHFIVAKMIFIYQSTSALSMYHQELNYIEETFLYLSQAVTNSTITSPPITNKHVDAIIALLERWPSGTRFPG